MEDTTTSNVISLAEFRKTHPKPSGKLYRDPNRKDGKKIQQDKRATPVPRSDAQQNSNPKLEEALRKYGSYSSNVRKNQFKKEPLAEG